MPGYADQSDAALAVLARDGELPAFDELARRYQAPLLRWIRRRLPQADAEDVVQETLVQAFRKLDQYRPAQRFKPWLFGIAQNKTIDHLRSIRRETNAPPAASEEAADPSSPLLDDERRTGLWTLASRLLSPQQFDALWLFYAEDLTSGEIARVQQRSWVSVKVQLHRARQTLGKHLQTSPDSNVPMSAKFAEAGKS